MINISVNYYFQDNIQMEKETDKEKNIDQCEKKKIVIALHPKNFQDL